MASPDIGVVHLVRAKNDPKQLMEFIRSYRQNIPEIPHDLIILLKGFKKGDELDQTLSLLDGMDHETLMVPDKGYDIASYFLATIKLQNQFLCFLNSYSVLQDTHWLEKFHAYGQIRGIGAVGATGSWQSHYSNSCVWLWPGVERSFLQNLPRYIFRRVRGFVLLRHEFPPFPNPHLRTNSFFLRRDIMLKVTARRGRTKWDALRFESGRHGLTHSISRMGLQVLVVGKNGEGYEPKRWDESGTFWCGPQSNLLVADNRTAEYDQADLETKWLLEEYAWGRRFSVA